MNALEWLACLYDGNLPGLWSSVDMRLGQGTELLAGYIWNARCFSLVCLVFMSLYASTLYAC